MRGVDRALLGDERDFRFFKALRPFSFAVALISCAIGIRLAYIDGFSDLWKAGIILVAGLLAQSGVNLINDMGDWRDLKQHQSQSVLGLVKRHFILGILCFFLSALIALYLLKDAHQALFWICVVGLIGALGYALPPVDLKARGLAVVLVFWLMGVLMIFGAYLAMGGGWSFSVFLNSIPVSLLVSELLLSNEIRDFEEDQHRGLRTLSVRLGLDRARLLYRVLIVITLALPILLYLAGYLPSPYWLLPALLLLPKPIRLLSLPEGERSELPPATARFLMIFGLCYLVALTP